MANFMYIIMLIVAFVFAFLIGMFITLLVYKPKNTKRKSFNTSVKNTLKGTTPASNEDYSTLQQNRSSVDNFASHDDFLEKIQ